MKKLLTGLSLTVGFIVVLALSFIFYAQFALDYSLENLREALEASQNPEMDTLSNQLYEKSLNSLALEEITRKNGDLESVVLLEHAAKSIQVAVQQNGYTQAGVYIAEILKEKSPQRNSVLRLADTVFHFFKNLMKSTQNLWKYIVKRMRFSKETPPLNETGVLILAEAEKMEKNWNLPEAERYYREFLSRFSDRQERGFVSISLAHVLIKSHRLKEATEILKNVTREFPGSREETLAESLFQRINFIQKKLNRIPELENWIKASPERLFLEEGGLELALSYLATYQVDRALHILEQLAQAKDPAVHVKAVFYQAWIHKWQGDLDQGKALFEMLEKDVHVENKLANVITAQIAQVYYEKKEYRKAIDMYEKLSRKAAGEAWQALSHVETISINLFGIGDIEAARKQLEELKNIFPKGGIDFELNQKRFEELIEKGYRNEGFGALAQGRLDEAVTIFENFLKKYPRDGMVHSAMASIYIIRGRLKEALDEAEKGFSFERNEYTASVYSYAFEKMERYQEAEEYYNIALQINPFYLTARFNLSWVYMKVGKFKEADALLSELEKNQAGMSAITQAKILNNHGCALWGLGRNQEAIERFEQALKLYPDFAEAKSNSSLAVGEKPVATVI